MCSRSAMLRLCSRTASFAAACCCMADDAMLGRRYVCLDMQEQAESHGQAAACSSGAVAEAEAAQAADAVQVWEC